MLKPVASKRLGRGPSGEERSSLGIIMKMLTLKITGWIHCVLTVLLAVVTFSLYCGYSEIHWNVLWNSSLVQTMLEDLQQNPDIMTALDAQDKDEMLQMLIEKQDEVVEGSWRLLAFFSTYHLTGLLAFVVSLLSPFCKPRWLAIVSIPIGLIALRLSLIIM